MLIAKLIIHKLKLCVQRYRGLARCTVVLFLLAELFIQYCN
jgi:hypothetical protein